MIILYIITYLYQCYLSYKNKSYTNNNIIKELKGVKNIIEVKEKFLKESLQCEIKNTTYCFIISI